MTETPITKRRSPLRVSTLTGTVIILVAVVLLFMLLSPMCSHPPGRPGHVQCKASLRQLCMGLIVYAEEHEGRYPPREQWCDLLVDGFVDAEGFRCPKAKGGPSNYAMNPNADPNDAGDIVLLFESGPGWNQWGGAELLTTQNHEGQGCCVLFSDYSVAFVPSDEIAALKWKSQASDSHEP